MPPRSTVADRVLLQHVDRATFLWEHRERAVNSLSATLAELAELDDALLANIEGIALAIRQGASLDGLLRAEENPCDRFVVVAAYLLAGDGASDNTHDRTIATGAIVGAVHAHAWSSACAWIGNPTARHAIEQRWAIGDPTSRAMALRAAHGVGAAPRRMLTDALASDDPTLLLSALDIVQRTAAAETTSRIRTLLTHSDAMVPRAAARAMVMLGESLTVREVLLHGAVDAELTADVCLLMQALPLKAAELALAQLWKAEHTLLIAVVASGALGDPRFIPLLIDAAADERVASAAIDAIIRITGNVGDALDASEPTAARTTDSDALRASWLATADRFEIGNRFLHGQAVTRANLCSLLLTAPQSVRRDAAVELALLVRGRGTLQVTAPAWRQRTLVHQWSKFDGETPQRAIV